VRRVFLFASLLAIASAGLLWSQSPSRARGSHPLQSYLGFDRNDYPGDDGLKLLRGEFSFAGYWLNNPPGSSSNSWSGKREVLQQLGFGFLVVFNGRTLAQIKAAGDAVRLGTEDGVAAAEAARHEGFPPHIVIFLDQEEGGRLLAEQRLYLHAWADAVQAAGFKTGVYCSGIAARESGGVTVVTAEDIREHAEGRRLTYWVSNDACPPSPGCAFPRVPPSPAASGVAFADVWQLAQSPRRGKFARHCAATYSQDGNCYAPGGEAERIHVDVDVATTEDPSKGRR